MTTNPKKRVLVVDALNLFLRNYIANPSLCADGLPCGAVKGLLQSLQKISKEMHPVHEIILVWDGEGGSKRRKRLNADYKSGRTPSRLNRSVRLLSENDEQQNKMDQMCRLISYLNEMPVVQLRQDNVEADDLIAYVCKLPQFSGMLKIIVSSDKDFFQLCNDEVLLYRPMQSEIMNVKRIVEKFGIHPNNFAFARALSGDDSDNLNGVKGVGLPTVAKRFPFMADKKECDINDIMQYAEEHKGKVTVYDRVLESKEKILLNYKMMQLYHPSMSPQAHFAVKNIVENYVPTFNQTLIISKMMLDGFADYNWENIFQTFRFIVAENGKK